MLKNHSGIAIKYFRLIIHLKYILIGRDNIAKTKNIKNEYLVGPSSINKFFNFVFAKIKGDTKKYANTITNPNNSLAKIFSGRPWFHALTQTYSDKFTLFRASTLCGSQYSYGPKKFQLGPLNSVPTTIKKIHKTNQPYKKANIEVRRDLKE